MSTLWKPLNKQQEWLALHNSNSESSYLQSAAFVKRLTLSAFSTILYHRRMFSQQCFQENIFFGTKVMLLKEKSGAPLVDFVSSSLLSVFDAFDNKYLHEIVFSIYEDTRRPETRMESYSFQFQYEGERTSFSLQGNTSRVSNLDALKEVQQATENMLRCALQVVRGVPPLPAQYELEFRVFYNESAPADYCPENFKDQPYDDDELLASLGIQARVRTHSHTLIMKNYNAAAAVIASQPSVEVNTIDEMSPSQVMQTASRSVGRTEEIVPEATARNIEYYHVLCVCELDILGDDVITSRLILCKYCNRLQHAACFHWFNEEEPTSHCCVQCALRDPERVCTDPSLLGLDTKTVRAKCVLRRTLEWCTHASYVTARLFSTSFQLSDITLNNLLNKLEKCRVLEPLPTTTQDPMNADRTVNSEAARETIERCLSRLRLQQTSSQDSGSELESRDRRRHYTAEPPVHSNQEQEEEATEVTAEPRTVLPSEPTKPKKDWAMKSAFQWIGESAEEGMETEELPLSGSHNPVQLQQLNNTKKRGTSLRRKRKSEDVDPNYSPYARNKRKNK